MNATVVVADDDGDIRRLVVLTLKRQGYTVLEAADGKTALALIQAEHPDVAVLDIMMPGLTGIEVVQRLGESPETHRIPVLFLSALAETADVREGIAAGARAYVTKPFAPRDVVDRVADLLRGHETIGPDRD